MATVTIDGKTITVDEGTLILDAARSIGINIPTFCYQAKLSRLASCRLCLVEIEGQKKLQPSCATPVLNGMVIYTKSSTVVEARRAMLEFILANHPLDCPVCDKGGECELQDMVFTFGPREGRFSETKRVFHTRDYVLSPVIIKNANRCVQCQRCVRMCEEIVGASAIGSIGRGVWTEETGFFKALRCDHCGNCIEVCPVGSLMNLPSRYKARPWDLKEVDTICPYCGTGCHLTVGLRDGSIVRVRSKRDTGVNEELLCVKGRFGLDFVIDKDRIKRPMVRKNKTLVPVSWQEALTYLKDKIDTVIKSGKPIGGIASPLLTNEELYTFQKLMRTTFKTDNIDTCDRWFGVKEASSIYKTIGRVISKLYTRRSISEVLEAESIFIIGGSVTDENPVTDYTLRRIALEKATSFFILSPRPSRLDILSSGYKRYTPGEEYYLISLLLKGLVECSNKEEGLKEEFSTLKGLMKELEGMKTRLTQVDKDFLNLLISRLIGSKTISILVGQDVFRSPLVLPAIKTLYNMVKLLKVLKKDVMLQFLYDRCNQMGAWDMGVMPGLLPGYKVVEDAGNRCLFRKLWHTSIPENDGINFGEMLDISMKGEMGALYIVGEDPLLTSPDGKFVRDALSKLDLLIVQDAFMTETVSLADVVLPGSTFAEKDGTFTNNEGRVQRVRPFYRPPFEAKTDLDIFNHIASVMGSQGLLDKPGDVFNEIRETIPSYNGLDFDNLGTDGGFTTGNLEFEDWDWETGIGRWETGNGKVVGFRFITGNHLYHSGYLSQRSKILCDLLESPFVEMNGRDAQRIEAKEGEDILVKSNGYEIRLKLKINEGLPQGIVFIPENFREIRLNLLMRRGEYPWRVELNRA